MDQENNLPSPVTAPENSNGVSLEAPVSNNDYGLPKEFGASSKALKRKTLLIATIPIVVLLILLFLIAGYLLFFSGDAENNQRAGNVPRNTLQISSLPEVPLQVSSSEVREVVFNNPLIANEALVLTPSLQPSTSVSGQIYYDEETDEVKVFDGDAYRALIAQIEGQEICYVGSDCGFATLGDIPTSVALPQDLSVTATPTFSNVNLTGNLAVSDGGTGASSFANNTLLVGNGTGAVGVTNSATSGQLVVANGSGRPQFVTLNGDATLSSSGAVDLSDTGVTAGTYGNGANYPVFTVDAEGRITSASQQALPGGGGGVGSLNTLTGALTIQGTANRVTVADNGSDTITLSTPQDIATTSSPTFTGLTVSSLTRGGDTITDFSGSGLQVTAGALETTLGNSIDGSEIVDGSVANADLANSSITINNGAGISGGAVVSLGGTVTLSSTLGTTIDTSEIIDGTILFADLGQNSCGLNDIIKWNGAAWACATDATGAGTNTFATIATPAGTSPVADNTTDTLTLAAGAGVSITGDAGTDTVTLAAVLGVDVDLTTEVTGILPVANGGTGSSNAQGAIDNISGLTTNGDLLYFDGSNSTRLARGSSGQCLTSNATTLVWTSCAGTGTTFFTLAGSTGTPQNINGGDTVTIAAGASGNLTSSAGATDTVTVDIISNPTFSGLVTLQAGVTVSPGQTLTIGGDAINDFTGSGLTMSGNSLTTTLGTDIVTSEIVNATILAEDLDATSPAGASEDNYVLTYDNATGGFTWVDPSGVGLPYSFDITDGSTTETINDSNTLTVVDGTNIDAVVSATDTLTINVIDNPTFSGLVTANGNLTVQAGDTFTFNNDAFTDLTGTGLTISGGALQTTLGTSIQDGEVDDDLTISGAGSVADGALSANVSLLGSDIDLTSEVSGILPVASGGTGSSTAGGARTNLGAAASGVNNDITSLTALTTITPASALTVGATGQSLTLQGSAATTITATDGGFTTVLSFATPTANVTLSLPALAAGSYDICTTSGNCLGGGGGGANTSLSNLSSVAINTSLLPGATTIDLGSDANPFRDAYLASTLIFEGSSADANEITIAVADPTADITYRFADAATGTYDICTTSGNCVGGGGGSAPSGADYVTLSANGSLTAERVLTAGTNVNLADGGANSTITLGVIDNPTFSGLVTLNGNVTIEAGDTFTFNNDAFTDLTGTGLQFNSGSLETTLGTTINSTEIVNGTILFEDLNQNSCGLNDIIKWNGAAWACATDATGAGTNTFSTIATPAGTSPVADSTTDTLTLAAGAGVTITGDAGTDTVTLAAVLGSTVDLASEVTGTLPVANGGTGVTSLTANGVLYGNGSSAIAATAAGTTGECLLATTGSAPSWGSCAGTGTTFFTIQGSAGTPQSVNGGDTVTIAAGSSGNLTSTAGATDTVTLDIISNPTFSGLVTLQAGVTLSAGQTLTASGDSIDDFTGTGLAMSGNSLVTTLGTSIESSEIVDATIAEVDLNVTNAPTGLDGYVLTFNEAGGNFTWVDPTSVGVSYSFDIDDGVTQQTVSNGDALTFTDGTNIDAVVSATDTITISVVNNPTFSGLATLNGGLTIEAGDTFTFNNDAFTDLTGTGLTISGNALTTTLGTAIDTSEITNGTILFEDLSQNSCGLNDIIKWNGAAWACASDNAGSASNSFTTIDAPGGTDPVAASPTDTLTLANGAGVTIIGDSGTDTITIAAVLGADVDLTSEVTGILPVANGGTGSSTAGGARTNLGAAESGANADITSTTALNTITPSGALTIGATGQALTLQGSAATQLTATDGGFTTTVGFGTPTANVTINFPVLSAGTYDVCTTSGNCLGGGGGGANTALSNLSSVAINTSLLTGATTIDLGSGAAPFRDLYLGGTGTNNFRFTGTATGPRTVTLPDASGTLAISASGNIALSAAGDISFTGTLPVTSGGTGLSSATTGDLLYASAANTYSALGIGLNNQCLIVSGGLPTWGSCTAGGGGFTSLSLDADTGTAETLSDTDTITIAGGTNIDTAVAATDTVTINLINNPTLTGLLTLNGGLTVEAGDTFTFNNDAFTDLTGTGLTIIGGELQTTLGTAIDGSEITNATIEAIDFESTNAPAPGLDNYVLTYDDATGGFTWVDPTAVGISYSFDIFDGTTTETIDNGNTFTFVDGSNIDVVVSATDTLTVSLTSTPTIAGLLTLNGGLTIEAGDTFTFNNDAFTDLTGTGLQFNSGSLETTLGTTINSTEIVNGTILFEDLNQNSCGLNDIIKWNGAAWACATDATGTPSNSFTTIDAPGGTDPVAASATDTLTLANGAGITIIGDSGTDTITIAAVLGADIDLTSEVTGILPVANGGTGSSTAGGARTNLGAAASGANSDITSLTALTAITPGSALTVGATGQQLTLQGSAATTLAATDGGFTTTVGFVTPTANVALNFPALAAGTYEFCTTSGNCLGGGGGANTALSNLSSVAINTSLLPGSTTIDLGSDANPFRSTYLSSSILFEGSTADSNEITVIVEDPTADVTYRLADATTGTYDICTTVGNCVGAGGGSAPSDAQYLTLAANGSLSAERVFTAGTNLGVVDGGANSTLTLNVVDNPTFTGLVTANGGLTVEAGDTFTFNNDAFTDLTGTGLQFNSGSLETTLGTSVDLTSEVTGILPVANGGTGSSTAGGARTNLGAAASGANSDITSLSGLTTALSISQGGTGATTQQGAINNLSGLTTNGDLLYYNGTNSVRLARGSDGDCLLSNTTTILWGTCTGDGVGIASLTLAGTSGTPQAVGDGDTITIAAGTDVTTVAGATTTVTINNTSTLSTVTGRGATTTTLLNLDGGIAVDTSNFTVDGTTGAVATAGTLQVSGLTTLNGGLTVEAGDTFTFNNDAFTDLTGTGLQINTGSLETTLGTSVDLTSEVTGVLPIANGGTGASTQQTAINALSGLTTDGDILYHNGTNVVRLARGTNGQCLLSNSTTITWNTCTGDGVGVTTLAAIGSAPNANGATISGTTLTLQPANGSFGGVVTTSAQTFAGVKTFNNGIILAANQTLRVTGGTTVTRTGLTPSAGEVFYDTDTNQFMFYNGTKWIADQRDALYVASTSTSSQADQDRADYLVDGTADQTEINTALTAAAGAKVILLEGTYVVDGSISIPNNTSLEGLGNGTVIELDDVDASVNVIVNSDTSTGTGVAIRSLAIDGRSDLNTTGDIFAIIFDAVGSVSSSRSGGVIENVTVRNFTTGGLSFYGGIVLSGSDYNVVKNTTVSNSGFGIYFDSSLSNTFSGNILRSNITGMYLDSGSNSNSITGNIVQNNSDTGISITGSSTSNSITSNTIDGNSTNGILLDNGFFYTTISGNTFTNNGNGIFLDIAHSNTITGNTFNSNAGALYLYASAENTITGNTIKNSSLGGYGSDSSDNNIVSSNSFTDNAGASIVLISDNLNNSFVNNTITDSEVSGYAIDIQDSSNISNYLSNNTYSGTGASSINDAGTGTIYAGQVDNAGNYDIQPAGTIELLANTNVTGLLTVSGNTTLGDASGDTLTVNAGSIQFANNFSSCTVINTDASGNLGCDTNTYLTSATAFLQGGNSFGAAAVLGTNDTYDLTFQTDGTTAITIDTSQNTTFAGNILGSSSATGTTGNTESTPRTNVTSITLDADSFDVNDVIFFDNAGQDYYTRIIVDNADGTYTVSPAVSYDADVTVTKYNIQNIGATTTDYTTQANRFFQGYFLGGVVTGAGSTTLSDQNLTSSGNLTIATQGSTTVSGAGTGSILTVDADNLSTGTGLYVSSSSGTIGSGNLLGVSQTGSLSNSNVLSGNVASILRDIEVNDASSAQVTMGSSTTGTSGGSGSITRSHTIAANSNRLLVVMVPAHSAVNPVSSVTFGGVPLTMLDSIESGDAGASVWYMVNPPVTTANVVVTGSTWFGAIIADFYNVDQSTPITGTQKEAGLAPDNTLPPITSGPNDLVVDVVEIDDSEGFTPGGGQTEIAEVYTNSINHAAASYKLGAAPNVTMSQDWSGGSDDYAHIGFNIESIGSAGVGIEGAAFEVSSNCTETTGSCFDSSQVLSVSQSFTGSTGTVFSLQGSGTGNLIDVIDGSTNVFSIADGGATTLGGTLQVDGSTNLGDGSGDSLTVNGTSITFADFTSCGTLSTNASGVLSCGGSSTGSDEIVTVAADDSTAAYKAAADYVADGTNDEVEINDALDDAGVGRVVLLPGTYVTSDTILIPNNVTLEGSGESTIIDFNDGSNTDNAIEATGTTRGGQAIRNLRIDGASGTGGTQHGIVLDTVGVGSAKGAVIENVTIFDFRNDGIQLVDSDDTRITGVTSDTNGTNGIFINNSDYTVVDESFILNSVAEGIWISGTSAYTTISNNTIINTGTGAIDDDGNGWSTITGNSIRTATFGIWMSGGSESTVAGNTIDNVSDNGIFVGGASTNVSVTSNNITNTTNEGIHFDNSNSNTVSGNRIEGAGGEGIYLSTTTDMIVNDNGIYLSGSVGIYLNATADSIVSGNRIDFPDSNGIALNNSSDNIVSSNRVHAVVSASESGIELFGNSDDNQLIGNRITDTGGSQHAISLAASTVDNTYLADNTYSGTGASTIDDQGTNTIYANQLDGSGNLRLQASGTSNIFLESDTDITGALTVSSTSTFSGQAIFSGVATDITTASGEDLTVVAAGAGIINLNDTVQIADTLDVQGASISVGTSSSTNGSLVFRNSTNAFTVTLSATAQTIGSAVISIPDTAGVSDTVCLFTLGNCDSSGGTDEIITVAANNSSAGEKAVADYTADGTSDEDEINSAIADAYNSGVGGKVVLLGGTFVIDGPILLETDITLEGSGSRASTIQAAADGGSPNDYAMILNADWATTGNNGITVRDLTLDGNKSNITASTVEQLVLVSVGNASSEFKGALIENVQFLDGEDEAIVIIDSDYITISDSFFDDSDLAAVYSDSTSDYMVIKDSVFTGALLSSNSALLEVNGDDAHIYNNTFKNRTTGGNGLIRLNGWGAQFYDNALINLGEGIRVEGDYNFIDGNSFAVISEEALQLINADYNRVQNNYFVAVATNNGDSPLESGGTSSYNTIDGNIFEDSGGAGGDSTIFMWQSGAAQYSTVISNNRFSDTTGSGTYYAIEITDVDINYTGISANTVLGNYTSAISDGGTDTQIAGQANVDDSYNFILGGDINLQAGGANTINLLSDTDITGDLTVSADTTLGDASGDTLTVNAGSIQFANNFTSCTVINSDGSGNLGCSTTAYLTSSLTDNTANALDLQEGTNNYININTTDGSENISFGNAVTNPDYSFLGTGTLTVSGATTINNTLTVTESLTNSGAAQIINVALGNDGNQDIIAGLQVNATSGSYGDDDNILGVFVNNITGYSNTTELGLGIGTGWDADLAFLDDTPVIAFADGGTLMFTDSSGGFNNNLFSIQDAGSVGNVTVTGTLQVDGNISIGTADTTGTLLVLDTKTNAGDPTGVNGAMYYNSNSDTFRCYENDQWRNCVGGLVYANTSVTGNSVSNTTTETNFASNYSIPADECQPGRVYRVTARGVFTSHSSPGTITMRVKLGTTTVGSTPAFTPIGFASTYGWETQFNITCITTGGSGSVEGQGWAKFQSTATAAQDLSMANSSTVTIDTTSSQTLQLSAQWGSAFVSNNITLRQLVLEAL